MDILADKLLPRQIEKIYTYFEQQASGLLEGEREVPLSHVKNICRRAGFKLKSTFRETMGRYPFGEEDGVVLVSSEFDVRD